MDKVLFAEGLGEKVFSASHAAALLNLPGTKWTFVRNHDDAKPRPSSKSAAKPEPSEQDGSGDNATGTDQVTRKVVDSGKRGKKLQKK